MSELQVSLIVLGVLVILAILGFNWWQDRRARQRIQASLPVVDDDPLLREARRGSDRREPGLGHLGLEQAADDVLEPSLAVLPSESSDEALEATAEPDSVTDAVIEIHFPGPLLGADLMVPLEQLHNMGRKPLQVFLQTEHGALTTRLVADQPYLSIQLAVLLADRSGAITAIEWSQLWNVAQALAEELDASVDGPEQNDVLDKAARLDSTCATLDAQVGLTLLLSSQRPVTDVIRSATAMGFVDQQGRLAWVGDHGLDCFTLARVDGEPLDAGMAGLDRLTLLLDVPRSPAHTRAFGHMLETGLELARRVGGELIDDQGKPVAPGADVLIDEQLQTLYGQLDAAGLAAGSRRARRVFA